MLSLVQEPVDLFDLRALFRAVDDARVDRGLSWTALAAEARVAVSTIRRFAHASDAEADGVLAVVCWLCVAPEAFNRRPRRAGAGRGRPGVPGPDDRSTHAARRALERTAS